jgi:long-chain acyl-CoA synthetase
MEMMPCPPVQGYGMTEAAPLVTVLTAEDHRRGMTDPESEWILSTAGRPVPGVDVRIVDTDGNEVAIGEAGEIALRGPNVMKGYLNKPEATAEVIRGGWYHSGDVAVRNPEGFVTIVDRMKDMIISGGENIYTTEVESVIMRHEAVLETTVIGVPDDKWGEVVKAFVVLKPGVSATEQELLDFTRDILAHFKCPRSVEFLDELPKSGAGKILKRDLRAKFWGEGRQVN